MKKLKLINLFAGVFLICIIGFVIAGNVDKIYFEDANTGEDLTNVRFLVYECADSNCDAVVQKVVDMNSGSNNYVTYEYPSIATKTYGAYMFKECYISTQDVYTNGGDGGNYEWTYLLTQKEGCHAPIDSFSVTNTNYANEPVLINVEAALEADVYSAFQDLIGNFYPSGFEDYYSVETLVTLEIVDDGGNVVYTDSEELNLLMDTSENVQFSWTPTDAGEYSARVSTDVTDCQCSSSIGQYSEKEFLVYEERPHDECYTLMNDLVASPQFAEEGEEVEITFTKISNYAADDYDKTAIGTDVILEIRNSANAIIYSDTKTIGANSDTMNTETVTFYWTPEEDGEYSIRVTGVGSSSLCDGKSNPEEVLTLGFIVEESDEPVVPEEYIVTFVVTDEATGDFVEDAVVEIGSFEGLTDEDGEVAFEVEAGTYSWDVEANGYYDEIGSVSVDSDKTVNVELEAIPPETYEVVFVVTDEDTGEFIEDAEVGFGDLVEETNEDGEAFFEVEEGWYNWEVEAEGYYDEDGEVYVNEDKTIEVELEGVPPEVYDVTFIILNKDGNALENADVEFGNLNDFTDENGKVTFEVEEGWYNWEAELDGYYDASGSIYVDDDKINYVWLEAGDLDVSLDYPNGGEVLSNTVHVLWTAVSDLESELEISIDYFKDGAWVELADELENSGSYDFDTNEVADGNYFLRVCAEDVVTGKVVCDISDNAFEISNDDGADPDHEEGNRLEKVITYGFETLEFGVPAETLPVYVEDDESIVLNKSVAEEISNWGVVLWTLIFGTIFLLLIIIILAFRR